MVSKCANPGCSSVFLYLHAGKIFRMEAETSNPVPASFGTDAEMQKPARRVEFFWLCNECASKTTLVLRQRRRKTQVAQAKAAAL
jgi:hypothetical protein